MNVKRLHKLLKQKIPLSKISEMLGVPLSDIFDTIRHKYKIILTNPEKLHNLKDPSIVKTSYSFKTMGFPAVDINDDIRGLLTKSHLYNRKNIYLDNLQEFDFRKKNKILRLLSLKKPVIISYVVPSNKKIPKSFSKHFKMVDHRVKPQHLNKWVKENCPEFDGNAFEIYKKCNFNISLTLNNIVNSELSDKVITKNYTIKQAATAIINSEDRHRVYTMMHYLDMPYFFVIAWIRQIAPQAYPKRIIEVLRTLEFVDLNKFKLNRDYIISILAYKIPRSNRTIMPHFPRLSPKRRKKKEKKEKVKITRGTIKKTKLKGFEF